jgi:hypothetical protein
MADGKRIETLRIGMIGSGFIAKFHLQGLIGVRNVVLAGVYSPTAAHREALARQADAMDLGPCKPFDSLAAMATSGAVDALWILAPNYARLEIMREINQLQKSGPRPPGGRRLREAAGAHGGGGARDAAAGRGRRPQPRLSGEPAVLDRRAARQGDHLAARRAQQRPALPGARRRGA